MGFKLGKETRDNLRTPYNKGRSTTVFQKKLDEGIDAEANNDGSIFIDPKVPLGSKRFERTIKHEAKHLMDMEEGRSAYGDEWVMWEDKIYFRRVIDGENVIDGPEGRLPEGHPDHPWEQSAIKAETDPNMEMEVKDISVQTIDEKDMDKMPESEDSPNKFLGKALKKLKGSKVGGFIAGGGLVGAGVRALTGGGKDDDGRAMSACDACEASGEGGEGEAVGDSNELSKKEKFQAMFGGKIGNPAWEKLQKKKSGSPSVTDGIGSII